MSTSTNITLRLPTELAERIKSAADEMDRSMNWYIVEQLKRATDLSSYQLDWPEQQFESSGAQFEATLDWYMPYFSTDDENDTELRIERALSDAAAILHTYGAKGAVTVSRIHHIGGSQLASRIRRFADSMISVDGGKAQRQLGYAPDVVEARSYDGEGPPDDEVTPAPACYGVFEHPTLSDSYGGSWVVVEGWVNESDNDSEVVYPSPYDADYPQWFGRDRAEAQAHADELNAIERARHERKMRMLQDLENDRGERS